MKNDVINIEDTLITPSNSYVKIRKLLINSAVNFLNNPRLKLTTNEEKKSFLIGKGLNNDEIDLAFELALARPLNDASLKNELNLLATRNVSTFNKIIELIYRILFWGGLFYGAYSLYKEIILPYLNGKSKTRSQEEIISLQITKLQEQIMELGKSVEIVYEFVSTYCKLRDDNFSKMRNELNSIKALLVNTNQFPPMPTISKWELNSKSNIISDKTEIINGEQ